MMLAALVRFPLIFIYGIFIAIAELPTEAQIVTFCSPLTYLVDGLNACMGQSTVIPVAVDALVLFAYSVMFLFGTSTILKKERVEGTMRAIVIANNKKRIRGKWGP